MTEAIDVPVIDRRTGQLVPMPDVRVCEREGCENSLVGYNPNARFCGAECRGAAWKARTGYGHPQRRRKRRANGTQRSTITVAMTREVHQLVKDHLAAGPAGAARPTIRAFVERAVAQAVAAEQAARGSSQPDG